MGLMTSKERIPSSSLAMAAVYSLLREKISNTSSPAPWNYLLNRRFNHEFTRNIQFKQGEDLLDLTVSSDPISSDWLVTIGDDEPLRVNASLLDDYTISAEVQNQLTRATVVHKENSLFIFHNDDVHELTIPEPSFTSSTVSSGSLLSPMPGRVIKVNVTEGQEVQEGDCLMIMEAMKMEHQIKATSAGRVSNIFFKVNDLVEAKKVLIEVKGDD